jgi:LytR cell envelope-related transcriptional attenuator
MRMAKREPPMSAAPAYIVYGHRHAVRLVSRLVAIGLLLAAIATVLFGIVWQRGSDGNQSAASARGSAAAAIAVHHDRTGNASVPVNKPAAKTPPPATKPKKHRPAKPIPPNSKIPVMVLNSNGISGLAHQMAARLQGAAYPIAYVGNAQKRGLPTIVQYAKGYGPAARKLAKLVGNVQFVTPLDGITPSQAGKAKLIVILGT